MLAVAWPFGSPARFTDSFDLAQDRPGGEQTRCACPESGRRAQTLPAFSPVAVARLGHATRPGEALKSQGRWMRVEMKWCFSLPFPLLTKEGE